MTRFVAAQLATTHTYDLRAARNDLGYEPSRSMSAVTDRVVAWWRSTTDLTSLEEGGAAEAAGAGKGADQ